ncbi:MAG: DUF2141 domain-containing protein [Myxococcales bacterium]|nr:DUF2141 domain-containing protein [Myxococcales bacterium]
MSIAVALMWPAVAAATPTITGEITGCSGEHVVYVRLFDETMFDEGSQPVQQVAVTPEQIRDGRFAFQLQQTPGIYGISVYEDVNGNGKLDMGWFGPKEPSRLYRRFTAWRKPRFSDVQFELTADLSVQLTL